MKSFVSIFIFGIIILFFFVGIFIVVVDECMFFFSFFHNATKFSSFRKLRAAIASSRSIFSSVCPPSFVFKFQKAIKSANVFPNDRMTQYMPAYRHIEDND